MDKSFRQQGSDSLRLDGFSAGLQIFISILNWLAGFVQLKDEERDEAGIYLGHLGC